ncbi:MAG: four helix bundle protein [Clostridia bacterium]|nr:four helix bundle protein [Clostridia bacterium]
MAESKLRNLSVDFSVKIIKLCESIKGHYSLTNQLERSGTSIGANIHEANYAQSKNDFISKLQIALKECYETEYWLELFVKSDLFDRENAKEIYNKCGTIRKLLISSINTAKDRKSKEEL